MAGLLSLERREDVAIVTLQRPEKRNALSIDLRIELTESFGALGDDEEVGAIVLTGAGPAFCSGMDVEPVRRRSRPPRAPGRDERVELHGRADCPKPVIAAVNGPPSRAASRSPSSAICELRPRTPASASPSCPAGSRRATPRHARPAAAPRLRADPDRPHPRRLRGAEDGDRQRVHPAEEMMPRAIELAGRIASGPRGGAGRDEAAHPQRPLAALRPPLRRGGASPPRGAARGRSRHGRLRLVSRLSADSLLDDEQGSGGHLDRRTWATRPGSSVLPQRQHLAAADALAARSGWSRSTTPSRPSPRRLAADPAAWATSKEPPQLGTLADFKRQKRDYLFSDHYREQWIPALVATDPGPLRGAGSRGHPGAGNRDPVVVVKEPGSHAADTLIDLFPRLLPDLPPAGRSRRRRLLARCLHRRQLGDRRGGLSALGRGPDGADPVAVQRPAPPHRGRPGDLCAPSPTGA